MAAPSYTPMQMPDGIFLCDGYQTMITFEADPDVSFWEITVQPPGIDGGEPVDSTNMYNQTWRTMCMRTLKTLTQCSGTAAYDPKVLPQLTALINVVNSITVHMPDGSKWLFWGALTSFEIEPHTEGEMPLVNWTITPTNQDPNTGTEEGPVYVPPTGTA